MCILRRAREQGENLLTGERLTASVLVAHPPCSHCTEGQAHDDADQKPDPDRSQGGKEVLRRPSNPQRLIPVRQVSSGLQDNLRASQKGGRRAPTSGPHRRASPRRRSTEVLYGVHTWDLPLFHVEDPHAGSVPVSPSLQSWLVPAQSQM